MTEKKEKRNIWLQICLLLIVAGINLFNERKVVIFFLIWKAFTTHVDF